MKGSVLRPVWPAQAAKTATRPAKDQTRRPTTIDDLESTQDTLIDPFNRITLAVLEEHAAAKVKGYDPYNTSAAAHRPAEAWQRKRKRD
jgi:hypothetical protein